MSQTTENTVKSSFRHNFTRYLISDPECFDRHSGQSSQSVTSIAAKNAPSRVPETVFAKPSANEEQITYPFSFPLCDMLICEFDAENTTFHNVTEVTTHLKSRTATTFPKFPVAVRGVVSVAEYVFQKVIRRKPVPFFHSETAPNYLGCYVVETLACGHEKTVYPTELETLTARKRNCHECSGWIGALQVGKRKAPASVKGIVRKRKDVGESPWWAIGFAIGCASLLIFGIFYALQPQDFYQVTARQDDFNLTIQRVHHGKPSQPWVMSFCPETPASFEAGHTLTSLDVSYRKDEVCYSLDSFSLLRDAAKCPIVPRNCSHTNCADRLTDHVICNGLPQFN